MKRTSDKKQKNSPTNDKSKGLFFIMHYEIWFLINMSERT